MKGMRGYIGKSGLRGVVWVEASKKWRGRLAIDGRLVNLGLFATPELASAAVEQARETGTINGAPVARQVIKIPLVVAPFVGNVCGVGERTGFLLGREYKRPGLMREMWGGSRFGSPWTAIVDAKDYDLTMAVVGHPLAERGRRVRGAWFVRWRAACSSPEAIGMLPASRGGHPVTLQRLLMSLSPGDSDDVIALDADFLNCRRNNLQLEAANRSGRVKREIAEKQERIRESAKVAERKRTAAEKGKYMGVSYREADGRWLARFGADIGGVRKTVYVGVYDSAGEAADARLKAVREYRQTGVLPVPTGRKWGRGDMAGGTGMAETTADETGGTVAEDVDTGVGNVYDDKRIEIETDNDPEEDFPL
ncbi:MAG: AP2/ERF family transcription factor [Sulfobacillus sp.]